VKRTALLHAELSRVIASLGHGDMLVLGDAGLPIPDRPVRIDLAVTPGLPRLSDVLAAVLSEMQVEGAIVAQEAMDAARAAGQALPAWYAGPLPGVPHAVPHEEFKRLCREARAMVRTGECTPYANIILRAGVTF
jgi:D-ribose pyranase